MLARFFIQTFFSTLLVNFLELEGYELKVWKTCQKNDPQINECVKNLFNSIAPQLKQGIPEILVESIDPAHLNYISVNVSGVFDVNGNYNNIVVKGLSNYAIKEAKTDLEKQRLDMKIFFPKLEVAGKMEGHGRLILLPYQQNGTFQTNANDIIVTYKIKFNRIMKNGEPYINFEKSLLDFTVKDIKFYLEDYKSKVLGQTMTQVLNDNPTLFLEFSKPVLSKLFFEVFESALKKIFMAVPENQIFL